MYAIVIKSTAFFEFQIKFQFQKTAQRKFKLTKEYVSMIEEKKPLLKISF